MYRISRIFETPLVTIVKVAGHVADSELATWTEFLEGAAGDARRWTVLDLCDAFRIDPEAAGLLVRQLSNRLLLLNCPTAIRNMAASAGFSSQVLEPGRRCRGATGGAA
jgi:hypothetical protein